MKTWYSKLLMATLFLLIPLQIFDELIIFKENAPVPIESFKSYTSIIRELIPAYFKGLLVLFFAFYVKKSFHPNIQMGTNSKNILKSISIATVVFVVNKIIPHFSSDTSSATYLFEPIIPGLRNWHVVTFLTLGVLEAFRYKFKGAKLALIFFIFYFIYLYSSQIVLNLLPDPAGYGYFPVLSAPENIFHWSYILPSIIVIYSAIIYMRLGFIPSIFFTFAIGSMGLIYSIFNSNVVMNNSLMNNYISCIAISTLLLRFLKNSNKDTKINYKTNHVKEHKTIEMSPISDQDLY